MQTNFDKLKIGNKYFDSRLMLGTGKYKTTSDAITSIQSSECEIVTVAIRRLPTNLKNESFLEELKSLRADVQVVVAFRMLPEVFYKRLSLFSSA